MSINLPRAYRFGQKVDYPAFGRLVAGDVGIVRTALGCVLHGQVVIVGDCCHCSFAQILPMVAKFVWSTILQGATVRRKILDDVTFIA